MKVAIIHLSDFHIKENDCFSQNKINEFLSGLKVIKNIDEYIIIFTGDLASSGKPNEYKCSRYLIGRLVNGVKQLNNNRFVNMFILPGNHDLTLTDHSRTRSDIQAAYDNNNIESMLNEEFSLLKNFYTYSNANGQNVFDRIINRRYCTFDNYKIQFNLINTAPFSTLKPDDKELHYFPQDKLYLLKKSDDVNLCITAMHHSNEWFNWKYKSDLEKNIIDNSEILLTGHDHQVHTNTVSINDSLDTWVSAAGEMVFTNINEQDSFNVIVIDTQTNDFDGYIFTWDLSSKMYIHNIVASQKTLQSHTSRISPLPSYLQTLKEDSYNFDEDFTQYFVFPKLVAEYKSRYGNHEEITTIKELNEEIWKSKRLLITGASNSGKTTLLKYIYCNIANTIMPLFLSIESNSKLTNLTKHLFEEQYGEDHSLYERYQQMDKSQKIILIDGWDLISNKHVKESLLSIIEHEFEYIVISVNNYYTDILESIRSDMSENMAFCELHIKPFFAENRNELVKNICIRKNIYDETNINNVNHLIDTIVHNNSELFSLNPAFIIKYTNYFINEPYHDYTKGEAVFSKIFEFELQQSIISLTKRSNIDEVFVAFEEIAGYMFENDMDLLRIETIREIINKYNSEYGTFINLKEVIEIGRQTKIFIQTDDMCIYFHNKNHLAYFVAKYLISRMHSDSADIKGIIKSIRYICFGINSDIVLFVSYLLNDTKTIMSILEQARILLAHWEELSMDKKNISILHNSKTIEISPPSESEIKMIEEQKEIAEEERYSEDIIDSKGVFNCQYDDIDKEPYKLIRAIKYTEMICKALPAFHSKLKLEKKHELIKAIYSYSRKIVYALLRPVDVNYDNISAELLSFSEKNNIRKKNGEKYSDNDIREMINDYARATMLSLYDHFSELCVSSKTVNLLQEISPTETGEKIQRLLIIENSGNTDVFLKEAERILKDSNDQDIKLIVKLIARKHILCNKNLPFNKKTQVIDKILGRGARKTFLLLK